MGLHDLGWIGLALGRRRSRVGHWRRAGHRLPRGHGAGARRAARCAPGGATRSIFDEFLLLGVIALSYGVALAAHALGFLAVFAAGLALRRADDIHANAQQAADKPPLTPSMLNVNEQLERIVEVAIVLLVGAMISTGYWSPPGLLLAGDAVRRDPSGGGVDRRARGGCRASAPRRLLAWFGIRGIGSVYYAVYFAGFELRDAVATELLSAVFTVIAASIVVHGISAAPLMELYRARRACGA